MAVATKKAPTKEPVEDVVEAASETVPLPRPNPETGDIEFDEVKLSSFPKDVELRSPFSELMLILAPEVSYDHQITGAKVITQPGVKVKFRGGRATIKREHLPLLAENQFFTGAGTKPVVFLEDDIRVTQAPVDTGARVVSGGISSMGGVSDQAQAPVRGWDQLSPAEIQEAVDAGRVKDIMAAVAFEFRIGNGRRREAVKNILFRAELGKDADIPVDAIEPDSSAGVPADARRV